MEKLLNLANKAKQNSFYLWLLNRVLYRVVPFNKPHKLKVLKIEDKGISILLPYAKVNLNHIKGIHACALATLCEYSCGLLLLLNLDPKKYRIILKEINMSYNYQGKTDVKVDFTLAEKLIQEIKLRLSGEEAIFQEFEVNVFDINNNHICTGKTKWQIKSWEKVRSR